MKKRLFSLALALALCLGLAVPVLAANTSGLDATTATAYFNILTSEINQYGIVSQSNNSGLEYVALEDMDANGTPELIVIRYDGTAIITAIINIWTMRGGDAVQTVHEEISAGGTLTEASIFLVRKPGQVAVCDSFEWYERAYSMGNPGEEWPEAEGGPLTFQLHYVDGTTEKIRATKASDIDATRAAFRKAWTADDICLMGGLGLWLHDNKAVETIKQVQTVLTSKANENTVSSTPATGTFGPYTIQSTTYEGPCTITFSAVKAERKTIQIRDFSYVDGGIYTPYETKTVTVLTLRPDTRVTVMGLINEEFAGHMNPVEFDGNNRYTLHIMGAYMGVHNGTGRNAFTEELLTGGFISYEDYLFTFDSGSTSVPATPSTPSSSSFSDVSANAYYADAVSWAVSKAITNGTSTTAFSPEENCTQAQILTFLWRASGKPTFNLGVLPTWVDEAYQEAVLWAAYKNMIDIVTFDPDKPCTRSMAVSYIWKALNCPTPAASAGFSDVSQSAAYAQAVSWAVGAGVTNGTSTTTFSPNDTCTRGQIVTFLHRAMG